MSVTNLLPEIRIDIVSDVVCPWCIIGYKRLQQALHDMADEARFLIEWHPFELNPMMPPEGEDVLEHLSRKYGASEEALRRNQQQITAYGDELGFHFHFENRRRIYNSFDAHRVLYWAQTQGDATPLQLAMFQAYFTHGRDISDRAALREVAAALDYDAAEVNAILTSDRYRTEVEEEMHRFAQQGIQAVPAYIINQRYLLSGAQDPVVMTDALRQVLREMAVAENA